MLAPIWPGKTPFCPFHGWIENTLDHALSISGVWSGADFLDSQRHTARNRYSPTENESSRGQCVHGLFADVGPPSNGLSFGPGNPSFAGRFAVAVFWLVAGLGNPDLPYRLEIKMPIIRGHYQLGHAPHRQVKRRGHDRLGSCPLNTS